MDSVNEHSRICSDHFIGGKRNGKGDTPQLFPWNSNKRKPPKERCLPPPAPRKRRYTTLTEKREIVTHDHCYTLKHNYSSCTDCEMQIHIQQASSGSQFLSSVHVHASETHVKLYCDAATNTVSSQTNSIETSRKIAEHSTMVTNASSQTIMQSYLSPFSIEQIAEDDKLVRFYTGFKDYHTFMICYEFLGSCVYHLHYWNTGSKSQ